MGREPHEKCPKCESLNTEKSHDIVDGHFTQILHCHHCKAIFHKKASAWKLIQNVQQ